MINSEVIIAHRGFSSLYPENTLISFRKALDTGVDFIELDIRLSSDNEIIVIHDETIDRTTDGKGRVDQLTLDQIRKYSAGKWFSESFSKEKVPTLIEVFELIGKKTKLMIEIKQPGIEDRLINLIECYDMTGNIICISYFLESVAEIKRLNPSIPIGIIKNCFDPGMLKDYLRANINMILTDYYQLIPNLLKICYINGLTLDVGTLNKEEDLKKALDMKLPIITTDYPQLLKKILEERKYQSIRGIVSAKIKID